MTADEQHHDHIWLTINGEGWAIRAIERDAARRPLRMLLWRGYVPALEACIADVSDVDWRLYCDRAVDYLAAPEMLPNFLNPERKSHEPHAPHLP